MALAWSLHQYCVELWWSQFGNNVNKQEEAKKLLENDERFGKLLIKRLRDLKKYFDYNSKSDASK